MLYLENLCLSIVIYWNMSQGLRVARGYELKAWKYEFKLKSTRSDPRVTRVQIDQDQKVQDLEVLVRIHKLQVWMQNHELRVQIH